MRTPKAHEKRPGVWEAKGRDGEARKSFYSSTKEQAERLAKESMFSLRLVGDDTLYGYFAGVFCPTVRHFAPGTKRGYAAAFDGWWIPRLGDTPLSQIRRADVQKILNELAKTASSGTVAQYRAKLVSVLDLAVSDGLIAGNPAKGTRVARVESVSPSPLSRSELWELYRSQEGELKNAVVLMGFFGLRVGEACGLLRSDVQEGLMRIERQWESPRLKTYSSKRVLPIPPECQFEDTGSLYFVGKQPQWVRHRLPVSPHALRHTFDTILEWELDCPRRVTNALMGHKGDVGDVYSHRSMEVLRTWLSRFWEHVCADQCDRPLSPPQVSPNQG